MKKIKCLSSFDLKILATITMLIDHFCYFFYYLLNDFTYTAGRIVGRLSFPLFSYLIYVGTNKTKNIKKYLKRLTIAAIFTQIVITIVGLGSKVIAPGYGIGFYKNINVLFSYIAMILITILLKQVINNKKIINKILSLVGSIILVLSLIFLPFEYGKEILLFFLVFNIADLCSSKLMKILVYLIATIGIIFIFSGINKYLFLSLIFILLYNGTKGKKMGYSFYLFYPIQFLIFNLLGVIIFLNRL